MKMCSPSEDAIKSLGSMTKGFAPSNCESKSKSFTASKTLLTSSKKSVIVPFSAIFGSRFSRVDVATLMDRIDLLLQY